MSQFVKLLSELSKGKLVEEADDRLGEIVKTIRENGGVASLTLTFKFRAMGGETVTVEGTTAEKLAKPVLMPSIFFLTEENILSRSNPNQPDLFRALDGGAKKETNGGGAKAL